MGCTLIEDSENAPEPTIDPEVCNGTSPNGRKVAACLTG